MNKTNQDTNDGMNNNLPHKGKKRKKPSPQKRRRRKEGFLKGEEIKKYRSSVKRNRLIQTASKLSFYQDAISTSENLLLSLGRDRFNKSLREDIGRDIITMKGKIARLEFEYQSAKNLTVARRCSRKRKKHDRTNQRYFNNLVGRRRRNRNGSKNSAQYNLSAIETDLQSHLEILGPDSDSNTDSEAEDETYVPEVLIRNKGKRKKPHGKRGSNESAIAEQDDVFAEEYECLHDKYQFAIDLKQKDNYPGEIIIIVKFNFS